MSQMNKAISCARSSLHLALTQLSNLEDGGSHKEVEKACDNIRDVLDQLCGWCNPKIKLYGKEDLLP